MSLWLLFAGAAGCGEAVGLRAQAARGAAGSTKVSVVLAELPNPALLAPMQAVAEAAAAASYRLLRREGYLTGSLRLLFSLVDPPLNPVGPSGGLAFALATVLAVLDQRRYPGVAATGILSEAGALTAVDGLAAKLQAALRVLPPGGLVLYPAANAQEIPPALHQAATDQGLELVAVARLDQALRRLGVELHQLYGDDPPYRGLASFRYQDAGLFFGRAVETQALCQRLRQAAAAGRAVLLLGASGSGKSSLIEAGILPELVKHDDLRWGLFRPRHLQGLADDDRAGFVTAVLDSWCQPDGLGPRTNVAPDPDHLAAWLQARRAGRPFLWVLDPLEELFTLGVPAAHLARLDQLLDALAAAGIWLLVGLRADFYGAFHGLPRLVHRCHDAHFDLLPPGREALQAMIEGPAALADCHFEQDPARGNLVYRLLDDVGDAGAVLPLLEFTLAELYRQRQGGLLTHATYAALGGLHGAIAQRAEAVFHHLPPPVQAALPQVLRQLVTTADASGLATARPLTLAHLPAAGEARQLLDALCQARLLVISGDQAEAQVRVAHEALLSHWPQAARILADNRQDLRLRQVLEQEAARWTSAAPADRPDYLRPRGKALEEAKDLQARWGTELAADLHAYIDASRQAEQTALAQQQAEATAKQRLLADKLQAEEHLRAAAETKRRRTQVFAALTTLLLVIAVALGGWAWEQRGKEMVAREEAQEQTKQAEHNLGLALVEKGVKAREEKRTAAAYLYALDGYRRLIPGKEPSAEALAGGVIAGGPGIQPAFVSPRSGHEDGWVMALAFSPDGRTLASGGGFNENPADLIQEFVLKRHAVRLWDLTTGKQLAELQGHAGPISSVGFSPDGRLLATASWDDTIRLWDSASGNAISVLEGHTENVSMVAFAPDGDTLASASFDGTVRLWDLATGKLLIELECHQGPVWSLAFSPDGRTLATGSADDNSIKLWDANTGQEKALLAGHEGTVTSLTFNTDGRHLASAGMDGTLRLWDLASRKPNGLLQIQNAGIRSLVFLPDQRTLIAGTDDHQILIWDTAQEEPAEILKGHEGAIFILALSPDGKTLASGGEDRSIMLWDLVQRQPRQPPDGHKASVNSVVFSPDGRTVASASDDKTIRLWDVAKGTLIRVLQGHEASVTGIAFSPDGRLLASAGGYDKTVRVWEVVSGKLKTVLAGHQGAVVSVAFSPDGTLLASAGEFSGEIYLWDAKSLGDGDSLKPLQIIEDAGSIKNLAFSPDSRKVITAGATGGGVRIWNTDGELDFQNLEGGDYVAYSPDGLLLAWSGTGFVTLWDQAEGWRVLDAPSGWITQVAFSPDGRTLAGAGGYEDQAGKTSKNGIWLWDVNSGTLLAILEGHGGLVRSVAFSPDGHTLVSGGADQTVRFWDLTDSHQWSKPGRQEPEDVLAYSPDSQTLASITPSRKMIHLWDVASGRHKAELSGHTDSVASIAFTRDGSVLASASWDGTVALWHPLSGLRQKTFKGQEDCGEGFPEDGRFTSLAVSPDGGTVVAGPEGIIGVEDTPLCLWDVGSSEPKTILSGHTGFINELAFSPDGLQLAAASMDDTLRLWKAQSGEALEPLAGQKLSVESVAFSPDGRTLASGGGDNTIRLWDLARLQPFAAFTGHQDGIKDLQFFAEGKFLFAVDGNGTVRLWEVATGRSLAAFQGPVPRSLVISPDERYLTLGGPTGVGLWELDFIRLLTDPVQAAMEIDRFSQQSPLLTTGGGENDKVGAHLFSPSLPPAWSPRHPFHWLPGADAGDGAAMIELGNLYLRDDDLLQAEHWYRKAQQISATAERAEERLAVLHRIQALP